MQKIKIIILAVILQACAQTPKVHQTTSVKTQRLPAQTLAPGDCGLFVWTADQERRFILFSQSQSKTGLWHDGGESHALTLIQASGDAAQNQFPNSQYSVASNTTLLLSLENRQVITDGTRFKSGTLTAKAGGAWERVSPVVGLAACQPR